MKQPRLAVLAALLSAASTATAHAQVDERAAVAEVTRLIRSDYVFPEKRAAIAAKLEASLASGRYAVEEPQAFAQRVTEDLQAASKDGHLYLQHDPAQSTALGARTGDAARDGDFWARLARENNHGVTELKILDGNVRYMNLMGFLWMADGSSAAALDGAMRFLKDGEAAVIDLRRNGGGSPEAVNYLISHFVEPDRLLMEFHMGGKPEPDRSVSRRDLPAGRLTGKPLYVLTSKRSASAAEEFAYHVSAFKLGELVGETTAGGAHRNDLFPVPNGYVLSVSVGRPVHPATGGNWEGAGVKPTVEASADGALTTAHLHALEELAAEDGPGKARYAWLAGTLAGQVRPAKLSAPAEAYVGRFGERVIAVENGALTYQRQGGPKSRMHPITPDTFAIDGDPNARVRVKLDAGRASAIELQRPDGSAAAFPRSE